MTPMWCCDMTFAALPEALQVVVDFHTVSLGHLGHRTFLQDKCPEVESKYANKTGSLYVGSAAHSLLEMHAK